MTAPRHTYVSRTLPLENRLGTESPTPYGPVTTSRPSSPRVPPIVADNTPSRSATAAPRCEKVVVEDVLLMGAVVIANSGTNHPLSMSSCVRVTRGVVQL